MKSPSPTGRLSRMRVSLHALLLASIAFVGGRAAGQAPCFDAPFVLPLDSVPIGIATADFNGDGILDLAVADGSLAVARGVGDGTFLPAVHIGPPGQARDAYSVVTGDFDSDGDVDIAVSYNLSSLVVIFRNGGTGSFTTSTFSVIGPESLALGDFDGDGDLDLAVMRDFNAGLVNLMLNTGGTSLSSPPSRSPFPISPR